MREDVMGNDEILRLIRELSIMDSTVASTILVKIEPVSRERILRVMNPAALEPILEHLDEAQLSELYANTPPRVRKQWDLNRTFPEGTVGRLMDPPVAIFPQSQTVAQTINELRELVRSEFITYGYVVDEKEALVGVLVMRDLLFAAGDERLDEIMVRGPFYLHPEEYLMDAMKRVVLHHFPVYPVCDAQGKIIGLIRGHRLFESQAYEITAQAGSMVGVDKEEQVSTPWPRSFRFRHPWLQLNLLTAFLAGAVVNFFQGTIDKVVILAAFLPVLAGQSGNTGCQSLAVTLRALTLGELKSSSARRAVFKEALLGFLNGTFVGISAGAGMYFLASSEGVGNPMVLSLIVVIAMIGSCVISGIAGALIPLTLKRLGADPATASSIFLTTATDIASMGMLLGLATWILL